MWEGSWATCGVEGGLERRERMVGGVLFLVEGGHRNVVDSSAIV